MRMDDVNSNSEKLHQRSLSNWHIPRDGFFDDIFFATSSTFAQLAHDRYFSI